MPSSTVIPVLHYLNVAEAVERLQVAFGFQLRLLIGNHRAQMKAGVGDFVIAHGEPGMMQIMVRVEDAKEMYERARESGFVVSGAPVDFPYGERQFSVEDHAGYIWTFSQSIADVDPAEWGGSLVAGN
jgi:uncharacterized glyoxalase superfamily protein PhnB